MYVYIYTQICICICICICTCICTWICIWLYDYIYIYVYIYIYISGDIPWYSINLTATFHLPKWKDAYNIRFLKSFVEGIAHSSRDTILWYSTNLTGDIIQKNQSMYHPLVNVYITTENHHSLWVNQWTKWPFSTAKC